MDRKRFSELDLLNDGALIARAATILAELEIAEDCIDQYIRTVIVVKYAAIVTILLISSLLITGIVALQSEATLIKYMFLAFTSGIIILLIFMVSDIVKRELDTSRVPITSAKRRIWYALDSLRSSETSEVRA